MIDGEVVVAVGALMFVVKPEHVPELVQDRVPWRCSSRCPG